MTVQDEGVARDKDATKFVELIKTCFKSLSIDVLSPTTLSSYLGRNHFEVLPPAGFAAVAVVICPTAGLLHDAPV